MGSFKRGSTRLFLPAMAIALAGCSVRGEPVLTGGEGTITSGETVRLLIPDDAQDDRIAFHRALGHAFDNAGYVQAEDGSIVVDFALSEIEADAALYFSEAGSDAPPPTPVVVVRRSRIIDGCTAVRTRAKLAAFARDGGKMVASSQAEAIACEDEEASYADLAKMLVNRIRAEQD